MTGEYEHNRYLVKAGKHYFKLMYFDTKIDIYYDPSEGESWDNHEILQYNKNGTYEESGPRGKAKTIRAALPRLQNHSRLPAKVKKALQGIKL
jgi:hypothetical protein